MAKKPITDPPSLGHLAQQVEAIQCWCHGCGRRALVPIADLIAAHGTDSIFVSLAERLRCSVCGSKNVDARPDWPDPLRRRD